MRVKIFVSLKKASSIRKAKPSSGRLHTLGYNEVRDVARR